MIGAGTARRPLGRTTVHVLIVLSLAFGLLAGAAGYWGVVEAPDLARSPNDAAVIAAARTVPRGLIRDRNGKVLADNKKDANGESYRVYAGRQISQVVGYASTTYGRAGLERSYDAELTGLAGDPLTDAFAKFGADRYDPKDLTLSLSWDLQKAAVAALGKHRGAVVMLDPKTGEVLALASTPTYDASAIANPETAKATFEGLQDDADQPLLPRATLGRYVPGSVFKIVTAVAGLGSEAITPDTTFKQQPAAEKTGLLVDGYRVRDGHHPSTGSNGARPDRCDRGVVQHLLRAGGTRDRRRRPRRVRRADGVRGRPAVRPADRRLAGDQRRREAAGRLHRRRRAGERLVRPGRDVRHAAPDGARRVHRRERRRADAAAPRDVDDRQEERDADDRPEVDGPGHLGHGRAVDQHGDGRGGRGRPRPAVHDRRGKVPGVTTAGKSGTAELGGTGEPHSWFIGFAPAEDPKVAIAVLVEQAGRGGEVAAPIAGDLMTLYLKGGR